MATAHRKIRGVLNFADLGGPTTRHGTRVRAGRIYRSGLLSALDDHNRDEIMALGIRQVLDLRSREEREKQPSNWPGDQLLDGHTDPGIEAVQPSNWRQKLRDPGFGESEARTELLKIYHVLPVAFAPHLRKLFRQLLDSGQGATLIHCSAGKDRTGFVCATILRALDVSEDQIEADYLRSAERIGDGEVESLLSRHLDTLDARARQALRVLASVSPDYLAGATARIERDFGSVDRYLTEACDLPEAARQALRAQLCE